MTRRVIFAALLATWSGCASSPTGSHATAPLKQKKAPPPARTAEVWLEVTSQSDGEHPLLTVTVAVKHGAKTTRKVVDELRAGVDFCEIRRPKGGKPFLLVSASAGGAVWAVEVREDVGAGKLVVWERYEPEEKERNQREELNPIPLPRRAQTKLLPCVFK